MIAPEGSQLPGLRPFDPSLSAPAQLRHLVRELRALRPRLVHVVDVWPTAFLAARLARVPRVLVTHHTPELPRQDNLAGRMLWRAGWATHPEVIYTSESDRETDGRKGVVIALGIDLRRFSVEPRAHDGPRRRQRRASRRAEGPAHARRGRARDPRALPGHAVRDRRRGRAARRARGGVGRAPGRAHGRSRRRARAARGLRRVRVPLALRGPLPRGDRGAGGRSPRRRDPGRRDPRDRRGRRDGADRAGGRSGRTRRRGLPPARGPRAWPNGSRRRRDAGCWTRFSVETMVERTIALYGSTSHRSTSTT